MLYYIILLLTILCYILFYYILLYYFISYYIILYYTILYYIILYFNILYYNILHYFNYINNSSPWMTFFIKMILLLNQARKNVLARSQIAKRQLDLNDVVIEDEVPDIGYDG